MNELRNKIEKLNVLVVGDLILDKYLFSDVERISPEAPVPVALVNKVENRLGGAANVAFNVKKVGANVTLFGLIGNDINSVEIKKMLQDNGIDFIGYSQEKYRTITKTRVVSKGNQMIRIDVEDKNIVLNREDLSAVKDLLKKKMQKFDIIIISDYQKGVVSQNLINFLLSLGKYVCMDSKNSYSNLKKMKFIKPNFSESKTIAKSLGDSFDYKNTDEDVEKMGKKLREKIGIDLLITRSEMGASYICDKCYHDKTKVSQVIDVTGAGDTCISIFSILDYLGFPKWKSLDVMNDAAKITVSHFGTYYPTFDEIFEDKMKCNFSKILDYNSLKEKVKKLRIENKKIVFTNGCFDLLHRGHVACLKEASDLGDILIVGLNSDSSVRKLKGPNRPIVDEESRAFVLSYFDFIDYIVIFNDKTPDRLINIIKPDIHVKGGDYKKDDLPETKLVESYGGEVKILKLSKGFSTTNIVEKIKKL